MQGWRKSHKRDLLVEFINLLRNLNIDVPAEFDGSKGAFLSALKILPELDDVDTFFKSRREKLTLAANDLVKGNAKLLKIFPERKIVPMTVFLNQTNQDEYEYIEWRSLNFSIGLLEALNGQKVTFGEDSQFFNLKQICEVLKEDTFYSFDISLEMPEKVFFNLELGEGPKMGKYFLLRSGLFSKKKKDITKWLEELKGNIIIYLINYDIEFKERKRLKERLQRIIKQEEEKDLKINQGLQDFKNMQFKLYKEEKISSYINRIGARFKDKILENLGTVKILVERDLKKLKSIFLDENQYKQLKNKNNEDTLGVLEDLKVDLTIQEDNLLDLSVPVQIDVKTIHKQIEDGKGKVFWVNVPFLNLAKLRFQKNKKELFKKLRLLNNDSYSISILEQKLSSTDQIEKENMVRLLLDNFLLFNQAGYFSS